MVVPDGNDPSMSKLLDLQMLAILPGQERTVGEYQTLFQQAGFKLTQIMPTMSPYSVIEGVPFDVAKTQPSLKTFFCQSENYVPCWCQWRSNK